MKKILLLAILNIFCTYNLLAQCIPTCPSWVNVSLIPNDCKATFTAASFITNAKSGCVYKLSFQYPSGTQTHSPAVKLDASHQGYTFKYMVIDSVSNTPCWGNVKVNYCDPCLIPTPPVLDSFKITSGGPYIPGSSVTLRAWAHDNKPIKKIEFYNWTELIGSDQSDPYQVTFTFKALNATENRFRAIVYDDCGHKATSDYLIITTTFPSCNDGYKNGSETSVDCGGGCVACHTYPPDPIWPLPDLMISNLSSLPYTVWANQWLQLNGKVKNIGSASASSTIVKAVLSTDTSFSNNDYALGTAPIPALSVNESANYAMNVVLPNWNYGSYYLIVCADPHYDIVESTKYNNCFRHRIYFEEPHHYEPDLITTYLAIDKTNIYHGEEFKVSYMTKNIGDGTAGYSTSALYLSTDYNYDYSDYKLSEHSIGSLAAGGVTTLSSVITKDIAPGHYYIIACADTKHQVSESNENNNCSYISLDIHGHSVHYPDLTASYLSVNKNPISSEEPFGIAFMINNIGNVQSPASKATVYLSDDKWVGYGDDILGKIQIPALPANQSVLTETGVHTKINAGHYYLIVCADDPEQIQEESEVNNCTYIEINISQKARPKCDLVVEYLDAPENWNTAENHKIRCRIRNIGYAESEATTASLGYADDGRGSNFVSLVHMNLPAMKTNEYCDTTITLSVTNQNSHGLRTLTICADNGNALDEANEANNCMSKQITLVAPLFDYKNISAVSFKSTFSKADTLLFPFSMTNQGNMPTKTVEVDYYLSFKPYIKSGSAVKLLIDTVTEAINGGDTLHKKVKLVFPSWVPATSYYLNICIDYNNKVTEVNEGNNCQSIRITLANPVVVNNANTLMDPPKLESRSFTTLKDVSMYPNPTFNRVNLRGIDRIFNVYSYRITDLNGKVILFSPLRSTSVDVSYLTGGVYLLTLSDGKESKIMRLIKN